MRRESIGWLIMLIIVGLIVWGVIVTTATQQERCDRQLALAPTISDTLQVVSANSRCHLE